jgi:hypothetical protein
MVWSFVYLALRRVLELMALAGGRRTPGRWRFWSSVTSWPSCAAGTHGLGSSPKTMRCLRPSATCCPGPDGRSSWSRPRRCFDGTATWCVGAGFIQRRHAAGHRFPSRCNPDRAAGHRKPTVGRPAHPRGAAGPWLPGLHRSIAGVLRANGLPRERPSRRWHPLIQPSRNCSGVGVVRAWSARPPGCHWTTTGRIRRFLGQAVTGGSLVWRRRRLRGAPFALVVDPGLRPRFFSVFPTPANFRSR